MQCRNSIEASVLYGEQKFFGTCANTCMYFYSEINVRNSEVGKKLPLNEMKKSETFLCKLVRYLSSRDPEISSQKKISNVLGYLRGW